MIWGLTNSFSYRNFTLSIFIHGVQGVTRSNGLMSDLVTAVSGIIQRKTVTTTNPSNDFWMNHVMHTGWQALKRLSMSL
jgi:hypothetical protein